MDTVEDVLEHFGVRGMKWGQRKAARSAHIQKTASPDFKSSRDAHAKAKTVGVHSLSNTELQAAITRMNLERQYSAVAPTSAGKKALKAGGKFAADVLVGAGKTQITKIVNDQAGKTVGSMINK